jgi:hypothetical protein
MGRSELTQVTSREPRRQIQFAVSQSLIPRNAENQFRGARGERLPDFWPRAKFSSDVCVCVRAAASFQVAGGGDDEVLALSPHTLYVLSAGRA